MKNEMNGGEWLEYRRLVLSEINRLDARLTSVGQTMNTMAVEMSQIQGSLNLARADLSELKTGLGQLNNVLRDLDEVEEDVADIKEGRKTQTQNQWAFWTAIGAAIISLLGVLVLAAIQLGA